MSSRVGHGALPHARGLKFESLHGGFLLPLVLFHSFIVVAQPAVHQDDLKLAEDFVERTIDEVFLALGWHLKEIHVTWAHLEKKWTRLRLSTKSFKEIMHTERGDGVARRKLVETTFHELWLCQLKFGLISLDSYLNIFNPLLDHNPTDIHLKSIDDDIK
ncbi:hypothetical protein Tco_0045475 [Tanacetum coccineum]